MFLCWPKPQFIGQFRWAGSDTVDIHKNWFHIRLVYWSDRQYIRQHLSDSVRTMV